MDQDLSFLDGPLFHYTSISKGELRPLEHVRQQVVDSMVYFPRPSQLNDDHDFRPLMRRPTEPEIIGYFCRPVPGLGGRTRMQAYGRQGKDRVLSRLRDKTKIQAAWNRMVEQFGVLSLSTRIDNAYLWGAYADGGKGVCLEYDLRGHWETGVTTWLPLRVSYSDKRTEMSYLEFAGASPAEAVELVAQWICSKLRRCPRTGNNWEAEEEIRLIAQLGRGQGQLIPLPQGALRALILGPKVEDSVTNEVLSWSSRVPIQFAKQDASGAIRLSEGHAE